MAWTGSGNFVRVHDWTDDEAAAIDILSTRMDEEDDNFATGIAACLTKNNETKPTANFNPNTTRTYSLGADAARWTYGYFGTGLDFKSAAGTSESTITFDYMGTIVSPSNRSGLRYHNTGASGGLYITQFASNGAINFRRDNEFDGVNNIARGTEASILDLGANETLDFYADSSLTSGNGYTPTLRWSIDATGKQVAGTVPIARLGAQGTYSTGSVDAGNTHTTVIAHGLGTDSLIVGAGSISSFNDFLLSYGSAGGYKGKIIGPANTSNDSVALPAISAGQVGFSLKNTDSSPHTYTVQWWAAVIS